MTMSSSSAAVYSSSVLCTEIVENGNVRPPESVLVLRLRGDAESKEETKRQTSELLRL